MSYKEVKLALAEVSSVAKGSERVQRSFSADKMLAKHPYLGKMLKKSMKKPEPVVARVGEPIMSVTRDDRPNTAALFSETAAMWAATSSRGGF